MQVHESCFLATLPSVNWCIYIALTHQLCKCVTNNYVNTFGCDVNRSFRTTKTDRKHRTTNYWTFMSWQREQNNAGS
jgi:hypothetical protein